MKGPVAAGIVRGGGFGGLCWVGAGELFPGAVVGGVCGAGSGFRVGWCGAERLQFLFFGGFLLVSGGLGFGGLGTGL